MFLRYFLFVFASYFFLCNFIYAEDLKITQPELLKPAKSNPLELINTKDIKKHVSFLASNALEGREAGTQGGYAAGAYIVNAVKKLKQFKPAGHDDPFQTFGNNYRNILFQLKGTDPDIGNEIILIGAHYDHVGYGNKTNSRGPYGYIHNGADDNASGVSLLIELAKAFQSIPYQGKRTLLFAFWDGEEKGLLGSQHWVKNPTHPLENIKLVFNIDMVGRLGKKPVKIIGTRSAYGLRKFMSMPTNKIPVKLEFAWLMDPNSDHFPFYKKNIPVAFFHTRKHVDYHRPTDDVNKVDFEGIEKQGRYIYKLLNVAINNKTLPKFRPESIPESLKKTAPNQTKFQNEQTRLGIKWAYEPSLRQKVIISKVYSGTPASEAGLKIGDEILSFDGFLVKENKDFRQIVNSSRQNIIAKVKKAKSKEIISTPITLLGKQQRFGIRWMTDSAEPESIILTYVATGSTAELAGLKEGDRIYQFNGVPINKINSLVEYTKSVEGSIPVQFESEGHIINSVLNFLPLQKIKENEPPNAIDEPKS